MGEGVEEDLSCGGDSGHKYPTLGGLFHRQQENQKAEGAAERSRHGRYV